MKTTTKKRTAQHSPQGLTTTHTRQDDNASLRKLQEIREIAWRQAIKYRWDPVLSRAHNEYLDMLNAMLSECATAQNCA